MPTPAFVGARLVRARRAVRMIEGVHKARPYNLNSNRNLCNFRKEIFALPGRAAVGLAVCPGMTQLENGTRRIFILEDEKPLFEILKLMLETRGWQCVAHAANPLSEKEAAGMGDRIDAALLDLNAGDANGLTVAGELRRLNPALPIVVMTGNSDAGLRERVAALRFSAVLQKPFSIATLEEALDTAFAG